MKKIALVVDDSATMRSMIKSTLDGQGFEVLSAQDGEKALKAAKHNDLTIVITDINMPNMDGIELIKQLRQEPKTKYTPILVISTEGGRDTKNSGKVAGASGWIVKPFQPEVLISAVTKLCG